MKSKILNSLLILTSLIGYLEWGKEQKQFLFQVEAEIFSKLFTDPTSVIHPFTIFPLGAQIILMITLFQKKPSKVLTFISIGGLGILLGLMFVIGLMGLNFKILFSVIPFLVTAFLTIRYYKKEGAVNGKKSL